MKIGGGTDVEDDSKTDANSHQVRVQGDGFELTIASERTQYLIGQTIPFSLTLENTGNRAMRVLVDGEIYAMTRLYVQSEGTAYGDASVTAMSPPFMDPLQDLASGKAIRYEYRALSRRTGGLVFPKPGQYKVKLAYPLDPFAGKMIETGELHIEVLQPVGDDARVWQRINDPHVLLFLQIGELGTEEATNVVKTLTNVLTEYPSTAYRSSIARALQEYYRDYSKNLDEQTKKLIRETIEIDQPASNQETEQEGAEAHRVVLQIAFLARDHKLDEALKKLNDALKQFPQSESVNDMRWPVALYLKDEERFIEAAKQMKLFLDYQIKNKKVLMPYYLETLAHTLIQAGNVDEAVAQTDRYVNWANEQTLPYAEELSRSRIMLLAEVDRAEQAAPIVESIVADAREAVQDNPNHFQYELALAKALVLRRDFFEAAKSPDAEAANQELRNFLTENLEKYKPGFPLLEIHVTEDLAGIRREVYNNPENAQEKLKTLKEHLESLIAADQVVDRKEEDFRQSIRFVEKELQFAITHAHLIGQKAPPVISDKWVNVRPLTASELEGKVVLLDFFDMVRGSYFGFSALRNLHARFHQQGLEIIGIAQYSEYDWDADKKTAKKASGLSKEQEAKALTDFAEYQRLQYPLLIVSGGAPVLDDFDVTIPQIVLIDRHGQIRLMRTGYSKRNASFDQLLTQLLTEKYE